MFSFWAAAPFFKSFIRYQCPSWQNMQKNFPINTGKQQQSLFSVKMTTAIKSQSQTISYILNIYLQGSFIMFKVLGKLKTLVIKGEDCLKKGQHLKKSQHKNTYNILMWIDRQWTKNFKTAVPPLEHTQLCDRYYFIMTKRIQGNSERDSRAQHIQISSSLGSPAVCTHNPATPPGSASSSFPLGCRPLKTKKTWRDDFRSRSGCLILW